MTAPLLSVSELSVHFAVRRHGWLGGEALTLKAVDRVSFQLGAGETLGVVGESGCGKSTLARAILRLVPLAAGRIVFAGDDLAALSEAEMRSRRRAMQIIFQDPLASLDPRMTVSEIIAEPLRSFHSELSKDEVRRRVHETMRKVGLHPNQANRYPHEFSGGQCQRIGIARAMILGPKLILCDEPVSALDVSIQAQIVNLLSHLQREFGLSFIFISHNLAVVRHISHRILVLYLGKIVELADRDALYRSPQHPYTKVLLSAVPIPDPVTERARQHANLTGDLPSPLAPPSGCPFRTRCPLASEICAREMPPLAEKASGHWVACHHA